MHPEAEVYAVIDSVKVHLGRLIDMLFATDTCVLVIKPTAEAPQKLAKLAEGSL